MTHQQFEPVFRRLLATHGAPVTTARAEQCRQWFADLEHFRIEHVTAAIEKLRLTRDEFPRFAALRAACFAERENATTTSNEDFDCDFCEGRGSYRIFTDNHEWVVACTCNAPKAVKMRRIALTESEHVAKRGVH